MYFRVIIIHGLICAGANAKCSLRPRTVVQAPTAAELIRTVLLYLHPVGAYDNCRPLGNLGSRLMTDKCI